MIAVIDFGSQYTHLITRRIINLGVRAEIFDPDTPLKQLQTKKLEGIILSGGPSSVYDKNSPKIDKKTLLSLKIPILGICYGHHLLAYLFGGQVTPGQTREYGEETLSIKKPQMILDTLEEKEVVWFSHGDDVTKLPSNWEILATTRDSKVAAYANEKLKVFGIQFHPEVTHTKKGIKILENFLFKICKATKDSEIKGIKENLIEALRQKIGNNKIIIGVSGGVDSLVAAELLHQAVGEKLYCVFIDTGLMRKNETKEIEKLFNSLHFHNFRTIKAARVFLKNLKGVTDPEAKRKRFSKVYFKVFANLAKNLKQQEKITFLAQGTIYPDLVEAAKTSKHASLIKSHHNTSVPKKFGMQIIEPLAQFYKDEVRKLGLSLGLPKQVLSRHPFPGPGLSIRVLGNITTVRLKIVQEADAIFIEELRIAGYYEKTWQAFAALLPVKTVGVMGDGRTYEYIISLRAVTSTDAMTADWARLPSVLLNKVAKRITNEVKGVNRVVYDLSQKPPATIEYE